MRALPDVDRNAAGYQEVDGAVQVPVAVAP